VATGRGLVRVVRALADLEPIEVVRDFVLVGVTVRPQPLRAMISPLMGPDEACNELLGRRHGRFGATASATT
jgi:hypothetical protein